MGQMNHLARGNTTVFTEDKTTYVKFHWTNVVAFNNETITLNSGGWMTTTTKARMNQASSQFGLGYSVFQKDFAWYVSYQGKTLDFFDGMTLKRN